MTEKRHVAVNHGRESTMEKGADGSLAPIALDATFPESTPLREVGQELRDGIDGMDGCLRVSCGLVGHAVLAAGSEHGTGGWT